MNADGKDIHDVLAYLGRIDYHGPVEPSVDTLRELHLAHMLAVPFENLDIHARRPIVLETARMFDKIVNRRRGGFCYELNGVFAWLLDALGFRVTLLSARVFTRGTLGPEFDHLALQVDLDETWIADVGFGESFVTPLRLNDRREQSDGRGSYRFEVDGGAHRLSKLSSGGTWDPQYVFEMIPRRLDEFDPMCTYHQTSPASSFTNGRLCSCATSVGRITIRDDRLIATINDDQLVRPIRPDEFDPLLLRHFSISVDPVEPERP